MKVDFLNHSESLNSNYSAGCVVVQAYHPSTLGVKAGQPGLYRENMSQRKSKTKTHELQRIPWCLGYSSEVEHLLSVQEALG
jgi:hypothetical protein